MDYKIISSEENKGLNMKLISLLEMEVQCIDKQFLSVLYMNARQCEKSFVEIDLWILSHVSANIV